MGLTAVVDQYGVGSLRVEWREPEPLLPDTVRVRIRAAALNYRDLLVVRGQYGSGAALPLVPGSDAAGDIVAVGAGVSGLSPGDRVCTHLTPEWTDGPLEARMRATTLGGPADGVFAEERVLPANAVVPVPKTLDYVHAACLPVAGLTAWSAIRSAGMDRVPGRMLLLGTGGVSLFGLQLGVALGCQCAVVSAAQHKRATAESLGASLVLDRLDPGWPAAVRRWSDGGVDLVLEVGGDGTFDQSVSATRDNGCVALIGVLAQRGQAVRLEDVLMRRIRVQGTFVGPRRELEALVSLVDQSGMQPTIGRQLAGLHNIRLAFAALQAARHAGKCVITLDSSGESPPQVGASPVC